MNQNRSPVSIGLRYARPIMLVAGVLFFVLGTGIAKYLGQPINWGRFWIGLGLVVMLQLMGYFLKAYYDMDYIENLLRRMTPEERDERKLAERELPRQQIMLMAASAMAVGAMMIALLITQNAVNSAVLIFIVLAFLLAYFYAVPPLRLAYNGYGELAEAILVANLFPGLAFLLQTGELHRLLAMMTFPLLVIFLATRLALSLERYPYNLRDGQKTMMVTLGWQRGMRLHNWLVPVAYLLVGLAFTQGLPWALTWPGLLTVPIGILEVIQIIRIAAGASPSWRLLNFTALTLLGLTGYFISLAFWTG
jgi:1,4-dihydroxy-2-naphthoate polyprenyltransferase